MDQDTLFTLLVRSTHPQDLRSEVKARFLRIVSVAELFNGLWAVVAWGTALDVRSWFLEANSALQDYSRMTYVVPLAPPTKENPNDNQ